MKDFNELLAQDREFRVQDQTFTWKDVRPEILTAFEVDVNGDDPNSVWAMMDKQILLFLPEAEQEKWTKLRADDSKPVTIAQMNAILTWLMEEQTGRPTEAPSPSASGPGKTGTSSKGA